MRLKNFSSKAFVFAGSAFAFALLALLSLSLTPYSIGASDPAFRPPLASAPDNELVNQINEITGFLEKDVGAASQEVVSPLTLGISAAATLWLGAGALPASVVGAAGDASPIDAPTFDSLDVTSAVVYGYADGAASASGVEGLAVGSIDSSGVGIQTMVTDSLGTAAAFDGRVFVSRDLYVEDFISAPHVYITSSDEAVPSITATGGISATAPIRDGAYGEANGGAAGVYGLYGQTLSQNADTARASGMYAVNSVGSGVSLTSAFYGMLAQSAADATGVGARGLSDVGNGVSALVGTSSSLSCLEAIATGDTGHALHASGGAFAAYFEGDVELTAGAVLFIGATGIGQENLRELIEWCNSGARVFCPDAYE